MVVDYVRHVLRVEDAGHEESHPDAPHLAITALSCSLVGQEHLVHVLPATRTAALYGVEASVESYYCNYGLNPDYRERLHNAGFHVSGVDSQGAVRIMELSGHAFYVGTLFVPQARSQPENPHPIIQGFIAAARAHHAISSP